MTLVTPHEFAAAWARSATSRDVLDEPAIVTYSHQGWGELVLGGSIFGSRICLCGQQFATGLGTHADSEIHFSFSTPARRFKAVVGLDENPGTKWNQLHIGSQLVFSIKENDREVWRSKRTTLADCDIVDIPLADVSEIRLFVTALDGATDYAHAVWADAVVELVDGSEVNLGESFEQQRLKSRPCFSFNYGETSSGEFLVHWTTKQIVDSKDDRLCVRNEYTDPDTHLTCILSLTQYVNHPAVHWDLSFRNDGPSDSKIISDVRSLDLVWPTGGKGFLHRSTGSTGSTEDFNYSVEPLQSDSSYAMTAGGGRSSTNWLPYFNIETDGTGFVAAVGWTGQWSCTVSRSESVISVSAGMELTHLKLAPGEEIRCPSTTVVFWQGKALEGNNALRSLINGFYTPHCYKENAVAPLTVGSWGGTITSDHLVNLKTIKSRQLSFDDYWVDAGWYGKEESWSPNEATGKWYTQAGNWYPNVIAHPEGMRPISDAARDAGLGFLLWFEPERAKYGSDLVREHPDWFISLGEGKPGDNLLLYLGNQAARRWLTDFISQKVEEWNIACYRQDFNFEPLPYWRANDTEDRQGITEIRHIEGLYAFLDELKRRHPGLLIDNCASGGRRLDLEMTKRSIPLWRSDFQCLDQSDTLVSQLQTLGLSYWLPLHGTTSHNRPGDTYNFRSSLSAALSVGLPSADADEATWNWLDKMVKEYKQARPLFTGEYYPLLEFSRSGEMWTAYQFHRRDLSAGMLVAFRREKSPFATADLRLMGLDLESSYRFRNSDSSEEVELNGKSLSDGGLAVTLPTPRSSSIYFYELIA